MVCAAAQTAAAKSHFVVFDHLLRVPALCYPLDSGWSGMGWIRWEVPAKTNPYLQSVILVNPSRRQIVQTAGQLNRGSFVLEQSGGIYSDANAMAAQMAREINSAQNTMVLSDSSLDPHEVEKLVGQGFWTAVD